MQKIDINHYLDNYKVVGNQSFSLNKVPFLSDINLKQVTQYYPTSIQSSDFIDKFHEVYSLQIGYKWKLLLARICEDSQNYVERNFEVCGNIKLSHNIQQQIQEFSDPQQVKLQSLLNEFYLATIHTQQVDNYFLQQLLEENQKQPQKQSNTYQSNSSSYNDYQEREIILNQIRTLVYAVTQSFKQKYNYNQSEKESKLIYVTLFEYISPQKMADQLQQQYIILAVGRASLDQDLFNMCESFRLQQFARCVPNFRLWPSGNTSLVGNIVDLITQYISYIRLSIDKESQNLNSKEILLRMQKNIISMQENIDKCRNQLKIPCYQKCAVICIDLQLNRPSNNSLLQNQMQYQRNNILLKILTDFKVPLFVPGFEMGYCCIEFQNQLYICFQWNQNVSSGQVGVSRNIGIPGVNLTNQISVMEKDICKYKKNVAQQLLHNITWQKDEESLQLIKRANNEQQEQNRVHKRKQFMNQFQETFKQAKKWIDMSNYENILNFTQEQTPYKQHNLFSVNIDLQLDQSVLNVNKSDQLFESLGTPINKVSTSNYSFIRNSPLGLSGILQLDDSKDEISQQRNQIKATSFMLNKSNIVTLKDGMLINELEDLMNKLDLSLFSKEDAYNNMNFFSQKDISKNSATVITIRNQILNEKIPQILFFKKAVDSQIMLQETFLKWLTFTLKYLMLNKQQIYVVLLYLEDTIQDNLLDFFLFRVFNEFLQNRKQYLEFIEVFIKNEVNEVFQNIKSKDWQKAENTLLIKVLKRHFSKNRFIRVIKKKQLQFTYKLCLTEDQVGKQRTDFEEFCYLVFSQMISNQLNQQGNKEYQQYMSIPIQQMPDKTIDLQADYQSWLEICIIFGMLEQTITYNIMDEQKDVIVLLSYIYFSCVLEPAINAGFMTFDDLYNCQINIKYEEEYLQTVLNKITRAPLFNIAMNQQLISPFIKAMLQESRRPVLGQNQTTVTDLYLKQDKSIKICRHLIFETEWIYNFAEAIHSFLLNKRINQSPVECKIYSFFKNKGQDQYFKFIRQQVNTFVKVFISDIGISDNTSATIIFTGQEQTSKQAAVDNIIMQMNFEKAKLTTDQHKVLNYINNATPSTELQTIIEQEQSREFESIYEQYSESIDLNQICDQFQKLKEMKFLVELVLKGVKEKDFQHKCQRILDQRDVIIKYKEYLQQVDYDQRRSIEEVKELNKILATLDERFRISNSNF